MEIVKKNLVSIICGGVALIAFGAIFWPISGWFDELRSKAGARANVYNQLNDLLTRQRSLPLVSLQEGAQPEKMEYFPTERVIAVGSKVKEDIAAEAKAMYKDAVALNQEGKKVLVPDVLPRPKGTSATNLLSKFRSEYIREMDYASPDSAKRTQSMPRRTMKAGMAPSEEEIRKEAKDIERRVQQAELVRDPKGKPLNEPQVKAKIQSLQEVLPDRMRSAVANDCLVYVDANSLEVAPGMTAGGPPPSPPQIFWSQIGLWLQEDVCRAINDANLGAKNVTESTVKRLVKISLPDLFARPQAVNNAGSEPDPNAAPATADPSQPLQKNFALSPTGRYSNPLYDVLKFKLSVMVDADRVPVFLQALSKSRFLTVYEANITAIDSGAEQAAGYIYGTRPVVQLDLSCEALLMREWTKQYMPPIVKAQLGIVEEPHPAPAP